MSSVDPNLHALDLLAGAEAGFALSILDASPDCIKLLDREGRLIFMNGNGLCAMEIDDFAAVDRRPWPALWPAEAEAQLSEAMQAAREGRVSRFEAFCPTAKGTPRWWQVTVSPVADDRGRVLRILASSRDVTEMVEARRQLEREVARRDEAIARQTILMGEIDHRVKNSFAAVIGLLRMQARLHAGGPAATQLTDAANRISTLARVHDQLHLDPASGDVALSDYIAALATDLAQALNAPIALDDRLPPGLRVPPAQVAAIGQILAELIGNAVKHAHPTTRPRLWLGLTQLDGMLSLTLADDGPGLPADFDPERSQGLGMQICRVYAQQMGGGLHHGPAEQGGAEFRVTLQLDRAAPS